MTFSHDYGLNELKTLLKCLEKRKDIQFFISYPNNDIGNEKMIKLIDKYVNENDHFILRKTFGHLNFLSMLKNVDFIIGNSSSGILEAPIFKTGSINIGNRQQGRNRTKSIIDCKCNSKQIYNSINTVYSSRFINKLKKVKLQYSKKFSAGNHKKHKKIIKNQKWKKFSNKIVMIKFLVDQDCSLISAMQKVDKSGFRSLVVIDKKNY